MSGEHPLFRFLDREKGPIVQLQTQIWGNTSSPFFYSMARLSPQISGSFRANDLLGFGGGGWSQSRLESQEKAIVEAIERWAFRFCVDKRLNDVGLEADATSNGFAALPQEFGLERCFLHSACEVIERFLLCSIWERKNVRLKSVDCRDLLSESFQLTFSAFLDGLTFYEFSFLAPPGQKLFPEVSVDWASIKFVLALRYQKDGGVVCGSACGFNTIMLAERAALEAFNHQRVLDASKLIDLPPEATVTDRRLIYFGTNKTAETMVKEVIEANLNTNELLAPPEFTLVKYLQGPWLPEVIVTRVLVADSLPIIEGDHTRFLI